LIPSPWALDHADHRLPAGMHIDVFFLPLGLSPTLSMQIPLSEANLVVRQDSPFPTTIGRLQ
jgi:hypothetical protein